MDGNLPNVTKTWHCLGKEEASFILAAVERSEFTFTVKDANRWLNSHLPPLNSHLPPLNSIFSLLAPTPTVLLLLFPLFRGLPLPGPFCPNPQHLISPPSYLTFQWHVSAINREYYHVLGGRWQSKAREIHLVLLRSQESYCYELVQCLTQWNWFSLYFAVLFI